MDGKTKIQQIGGANAIRLCLPEERIVEDDKANGQLPGVITFITRGNGIRA